MSAMDHYPDCLRPDCTVADRSVPHRCVGPTEQAAANVKSGPVPPHGPGPKPEEGRLPPPVEAFPTADFQMAQRALNEIRLGLGFTRELVTSLPLNPEMRLDTIAMRKAMRIIITRLENAERACLQLGIPF